MSQALGQEPTDVRKPDDDDIRLWSVTTLIGALDKPALVYWSANKTAEAAVDDANVWMPMADKSRKEAVDWLSKARYRTADGERSATELGTVIHKWLEEYVLTGTRPEMDEEMRPMCEALDRWLEAWQPEWEASEVTVYHPDLGYAGTCDGFLKMDGVRFIYDLKTTKEHLDSKGNRKGPFPEVALQLAAYRYAAHAAVWKPRRYERFKRRYYLLSDEERQMAASVPEVDAGMCLHVTPEDAQAYPVRCGPEVFRAWKYVIGAARWQLQDGKDAIGDPLVPPAREGVA